MKVLRLLISVGPTSAPYNQFTLGMVNQSKQTVCAYFPTECEVDSNIIYHEGNGTVFGMISLLSNILSRNDYDIIHLHSGHMGLILILSLFPLNMKMLGHTAFTLHTSFHLLSSRNKAMVILTALFVKKTCACGLSSLKSFPGWLCKILGRRLCCIVNGYDERRIHQLSIQSNDKKLFANLPGLKMVCIGALNNNKNQISVLRAIKYSTEIQGELLFLGDGPNRAKLEKYAETINSNVQLQFVGKVSREQSIQYMLEADIFISLSKGEGMPIAVLEAMGAGCTTILSDIAPHREINATSGTSFLVDPDDLDSISNIVQNIFLMDKSQLRELGQSAKKHVIDNFKLEKMINNYFKIYNSIK